MWPSENAVTDATGAELRLGFIYPAGSGDQEYYTFADTVDANLRILMLSSRLWGNDKDHDIDCLLKTGDIEQLAAAATKFKQLAPDSVMWACTSASFVGGVQWAHDQVKAIETACDAPSGGTSLAIVEALRRLGVERVAIMATYPPDIADRLRSFLEHKGLSVVGVRALNLISGWDAGRLPADLMMREISRADIAHAQAIVVPDTAIPTLHYLDEIERQLGKPVICANQATLWKGVRLAGSSLSPSGFGQLWSY